MPVLFGIAGLVLIIAGVRNRITAGNPSLVQLLEADFSGNDPFWKWMLALILIGSIGYIPNLRPVSRAFMTLVIVVFLLSNKGVFAKLSSVFTSNATSAPQTNTQSSSANNLLNEALPGLTDSASSSLPQTNETGLNDLASLGNLV